MKNHDHVSNMFVYPQKYTKMSLTAFDHQKIYIYMNIRRVESDYNADLWGILKRQYDAGFEPPDTLVGERVATIS